MIVKNLSQLKKALADGCEFQIIKHYIKPEHTGEVRKVKKMQTNGMYSVVTNNDNSVVNTWNDGKGSWIDFGKAKDWNFGEDGVITFSPIFKGEPRPVWAIKLI